MKTLDITVKQKISYCIPIELRNEQIKININKVKDRIQPGDLKHEPIALVSFGPSLNKTWPALKKFKHIMTCSGAHKFLIEKGIIPTWHADLDPRDYKIKILGAPHKDVEYLIASTIHPNYLEALKDYKVKLWHIFANDDEAEMILPKGEYKITGGSSVGLRTMTLARFMGYTDFHIFGMDGSFAEGNTHTTPHPNAPPPESFETVYNGKKYKTTPSILHVAKETFHELDQMSDVKAKFYGEGLVQDMAKDYKPNHKRNTIIAFNSPELISKEYIELNHKLHQDNPSYGMGGGKYAKTVLQLSEANKTTSILDYGCGKGLLAKELPFPIWQYDPAIPEHSAIPKPADIVICTDVLEHIELDKLIIVLDDLRRVVKKVGYFVISTRKAGKTYANGENAHLIVQGKDWWEKNLKKFFDIGTIIAKEKESELHVVVGPKTVVQPDMAVIEKDGLKFKFYTPNDTTKWRAKTLFTKEPSTIEWIDSMKPGEILFDVGANIGSYSIYAGVKGLKVYSFEPEAENYALLIKNLNLNGIEPNAYCMAISDKTEAGTLFASGNEIGGACHSFNEKVGFDLAPRETKFTQGCLGMDMETLIQSGLPVPNHIKIDVDGFEHKVIEGLRQHLKFGELKSILIEINPSLQQHLEMIKTLQSFGFEFSPEQVDSATRKDGPFKGCAEYVFRKKIDAKNSINSEPYPYMVFKNVFNEEIYRNVVNTLPHLEYKSLEEARGTKGYPERFIATIDIGQEHGLGSYIGGEINRIVDELCTSFGLIRNTLDVDVFFIKDKPGYKIGVHRDRLDKVVSALIYLPKDNSDKHAGTTIYKPKKEGFTCPIGKHYGFDEFEKVLTVPYEPNTMFAFLNTDHSFHGVEPCSVERNLLLINLNKKP